MEDAPADTSAHSKSSDPSTEVISNLTRNTELVVHPDMYDKLLVLKEEFQACTDDLYARLNGVTIESLEGTNTELATNEVVEKACSHSKLHKPVLLELFKKLYIAAKPLCSTEVKRKGSQDLSTSMNGSIGSPLEHVDKTLPAILEKLACQTKQSDERMSMMENQMREFTSALNRFSETTSRKSTNLDLLPRPESDDWEIPESETTTPIEHSFKHHSVFKENFIDGVNLDELTQFLQKQQYAEEGGRSTLLFGESYKYMGNNSQPKPMPQELQGLVDRLNTEYSGDKYTLNSVLINQYKGKDSFLPEHSDNEFWIDPASSIFTVSIGDPRDVVFKDRFSKDEHKIATPTGSLYAMTRNSQSAFSHRIDKDSNFDEKVRYSLTIRASHWTFLNSTVIVGDSNTRNLKFGSGVGTLGKATPGQRVESIHVENIDPEACVSYRNVVLMVGTNDLKKKTLHRQADIQKLIQVYKKKLDEVKKLNPRCRILIVPVIPSRAQEDVDKINYFNSLITRQLVQHFPNLFIVSGMHEFSDERGNLAGRYDTGDRTGLHLNTKGIRVLAGYIKSAIFQAKSSGRKVHSNRLYSSAVKTG